MQKHLTALVVLTILLSACQKEVSLDSNSTPGPTNLLVVSDSLRAIVVDGAYAGSSISYDSAVITYGSQLTTIKHYSGPATLFGSEIFGYDASNRITNAAFADIANTTNNSRAFTYNGADSFPQKITNTITAPSTNYIEKFVFANPVAAGTGRRFTVYEDVQDVINQGASYLDTSEVLLNAVSQLREYSSSGIASQYFYNPANDIDSSHSAKTTGEESSYAATYSTTNNPLAGSLHRIYKNLLRFAVTDQLDNGEVETSLNICYLPSDLLSLKVPVQIRRGYYGINTEKLTYTYTIQNNLVTGIVINALDVSTGMTSTTRLRFYYR